MKTGQTITVVNSQMGNIGSVVKKLKRIGVNVLVASNDRDILNATKIVLPGVGHFSTAVKRLKQFNMWESLNETVIEKNTPILGICLGMQLMAKHSEEGSCNGFGWFDAEVVKFRINESEKTKFKVPHTGWNTIVAKKQNSLLEGVSESGEFYFVHSYHLKCNEQSDILTITDYSYSFVSAIQKDNIYGVQFHPEKSHDIGEQLLRNFVKI